MRVHLIKDGDVSNETFTEVVDLLNAIEGPIQFICDNNSLINFSEDDIIENIILDRKSFEQAISVRNSEYSSNKSTESKIEYRIFNFPFSRKASNWTTIFDKCNSYRLNNVVGNNDFVLLLTEMSNDKNWFASLNEKMPYDGFIHTSDWNHYIKCNDAFPIAYEVIALILQKHMFNNYKEAQKQVHLDPIGCVNDMCMEKKDIKLKLRTADICQDCMEKLKGKLTIAEIHQVLNIMESLRVKMLFSQNFKQNTPLSRLVIDERSRIWLPEFGNIEIKLRPLEKALYLLYLNHPEGIGLSFLCDYKTELIDIYRQYFNNDDRDLIATNELIEKRIGDLVNITNNSSAEKISRIKSVFIKAIGQELAKHYYIQGGNGEVKKLRLDRGLVNKFLSIE